MISTSPSGRDCRFNYDVGHLRIASDQPLPELQSWSGRAADLRVFRPCGEWDERVARDCFMQWDDWRGERWLSFRRTANGYLLQFPGMADFIVDARGEEIRYWTDRETPAETLRHLLLDQVIPLVINLRGGESLHAGAARLPSGAVAFCGASGAGKSTLVASFVKAGHRLLGDDCVVIRVSSKAALEIIALYPGLRMGPASMRRVFGNSIEHSQVAHYTAKQRLHLEKSDAPGWEPLKRIYVLGSSGNEDGIRITPLPPAQALVELIRSAFRLDIEDSNMLKRQFVHLGEVAAAVPVKRLCYPRDFGQLSAVRQAIEADLNAPERGD